MLPPTGPTSSTRRYQARQVRQQIWTCLIRRDEEILKVHARNKPLDQGVDLKSREAHPGFTGADLSNLLNEAALLAARHNRKRISQAEISRP